MIDKRKIISIIIQKWGLFIFLGLLLFPYQASGALSRPVNNLGLIAYYPLDENRGTNVSDLSGNRHTGSAVNAPWVSGKRNSALSFNGSDQFVSLPPSIYPSLSNGTEMTIAFWFKGTDIESAVRLQSTAGDFIVVPWDNGASPNWVIISTDGSTGNGVEIANVENDQWHHVAVTWKRNTANGFKVYVDGEISAQRASADANLPDFSTVSFNPTLGKYENGSEYMTGVLDEVRIYSRELLQTEVKSLHKTGSALVGGGEKKKVISGLVGHWTFNGNDVNWSSATAGIVYDRSGQGNDGTINGLNQSSSPVRGKIGQAMNFDGSDDYVGFGTPLNSDNVSIFMWVKPNTWSTQWTTLISNQVGSSPYGGFDIRKKNAGAGDSTLEVAISVGSTDYVADAGSINTGVWQLVGFTYDGETLITYLNGAQIASEPAPSGSLRNSTENANLGRNPTFSGRNFDGSIDDVRIFSRALSSAEIDQLYKLGSGAMIRRN